MLDNLSYFSQFRKVFRRLNFRISDDSIKAICVCKPIVIECFLMFLRSKIERALWELKKGRNERVEINHQQQKASQRLQGGKPTRPLLASDQPEADQNLSEYLPKLRCSLKSYMKIVKN